MSVEIHRPAFINNTIVGFVTEPDGRGTLSILFSCLLTLSLCVWSAVHLNLPRSGEGEALYAYRYFKWSVLGIFGPELVIWAAWRQFLSARRLTQVIQEIHQDTNRPAPANKWTIVHSFYAGMGGFVFDIKALQAEGDAFIPHLERLHITPRGIQLLAKCDLLPSISRDEIIDKNKADRTAKLVCCLQVSWMLVQAVARVSLGLAVTPLETNTIGHVLCAFINYALWWHKPKWIREPTIVTGRWARAVCAFMYMSSQISSGDDEDKSFLRDFGVYPEMSNMLYIPTTVDTPEVSQSQDETPPHLGNSGDAGCEVPGGAIPPPAPAPDSANGTCQIGAFIPRRRHTGISDANDPSVRPGFKPKNTLLREMQAARWRLACEAMEAHPAIRERLELAETDKDETRYREALRLYPEMPQKVKRHFKRTGQQNGPLSAEETLYRVCMPEELVVERPKNWPGDDLVRDMQGHLMGIILWTVTTLYGAIHLGGWNEQFPTVIEQWLWRASAAYIVFSGLLWSFLNLLGHVSGSVWWFWYDMLAGHGSPRGYYILLALCYLGGALYVVARVYLVVEAFISLRALPASAYQSPSWILTVPHL